MLSSKSLLTLTAVALVTLVVGGCGKSSDAPTILDLAPPAVPTNLGAVYASDVVKVSWDPNTTDADFAGFKVSRLVHGSELVLIANPTDITQYIDQTPSMGINQYQVTAVDQSGNESAYTSVVINVLPLQPVLPQD